jgi:hypothetical protein
MAGERIPLEDQFERDGITQAQRDQLIWKLRRKGWSQARIGAHPQVRMTQVGVKYVCDRLAGKPRKQSVPMDMCEGCWADKPKNQLNHEGICPACAE